MRLTGGDSAAAASGGAGGRLIVRPEVVGALLALGADPDKASSGAATAPTTAREVIIASRDRALLALLEERGRSEAEPEPRSPGSP